LQKTAHAIPIQRTRTAAILNYAALTNSNFSVKLVHTMSLSRKRESE